MMKITRNDTTVGAFLLIAIAAVATFLIVKAQNEGAFGAIYFSTVVNDPFGARGLKVDAPVRTLGTDVGRVVSIKPNDDELIEVRFRVDPKFAKILHEDAKATIVEPPALGVTYLNLKPGTPTASAKVEVELQSDKRAGGKAKPIVMPYDTPSSLLDTLDASVKKVDAILAKTDAALAQANTTLKSVSDITTQISQGNGFVSRLLKDQQLANDLQKTIAEVAVISQDAADVSARVRRGEGSLGRVLSSNELAVESEQLLAQARTSLKNLDEVTQKLTTSVQTVANRLDQAGSSVEGLKGVIDNTQKLTGQLAELTTKINQGKGSLGKLMNDDAVFVEAKGLLKEVRESIQDLREQAPINSFIGVVFSAF